MLYRHSSHNNQIGSPYFNIAPRKKQKLDEKEHDILFRKNNKVSTRYILKCEGKYTLNLLLQ